MSVQLKVPFKDKDCVKALGASWNSEKKVWYVSSLDDITPFRKWLPTGRALLKIFLQVEEDKHKLEQAEKVAAVEFEMVVAHQCAGQQAGFTEDLKAVADAQHMAALIGKFNHALHDG
jgi:hypothetical protein